MKREMSRMPGASDATEPDTLREHQLLPIRSTESRYTWKCRVCLQKWTSKPSPTCLGMLTYAFRSERLDDHRTVEELAEEQLQPCNVNLPVAALRFVGMFLHPFSEACGPFHTSRKPCAPASGQTSSALACPEA